MIFWLLPFLSFPLWFIATQIRTSFVLKKLYFTIWGWIRGWKVDVLDGTHASNQQIKEILEGEIEDIYHLGLQIILIFS